VARIADGLGLNPRLMRIKPRINKQCIKVVGPAVTGPAISPRTEKIKADT